MVNVQKCILSERNCYTRLARSYRLAETLSGYLGTTPCLGCQNIVRMATAKVDKGGNKSNNVCGLHSGFLKFLTRFHKKSTHRNLLRTFVYKTQKDLQQRSHHAPPRAATDS